MRKTATQNTTNLKEREKWRRKKNANSKSAESVFEMEFLKKTHVYNFRLQIIYHEWEFWMWACINM